jgi:hypothetical protein
MKPSRVVAVAFITLLVPRLAFPSPQTTVPASLFQDIKSPDWMRRADGYAAMEQNQEGMRHSDVQKALVELLDRENHVLHQTLVESNGEVGVAIKYGEDYGDYYSKLLNTVFDIADWNDQRQVCVVAQGGYDPASPFAAGLVSKGGAIVASCLIKLAQSRYEFDRYQSIPVLVQLSAVIADLQPKVRDEIRQATISGLRDPSVSVRHVIVRAVGKFGTPELIPVLQDLARSDPYSEPINDGKDQRFEIRELAREAVQSIQERAKAQ